MFDAPKPTIRNVGIISKPRSDRAGAVIAELVEFLRARSIGVRLDSESTQYVGGETSSRQDLAAWADMLIVLGGDGTLQATARASIGREIPVFAVNLGGLGFLTAIKLEDLYPQLSAALEGNYRLGRRRMLH